MNRSFIAFLGLVLLILIQQYVRMERERPLTESSAPPAQSTRSDPSHQNGPILEEGPTSQFSEQALVRVKRVVDGDTLLLTNGERVRLFGVDTPETKKPDTPVQPFGPEASEFTRQMVEGQVVTLVFDRERYDKFGRTLAFVFVNQICLNEELIRQGLSAAQLQYPFRSDMKQRFTRAEAEAREHRRGLWSIPGWDGRMQNLPPLSNPSNSPARPQ